MTGSTGRPHVPGTILLKIARLVFSEHVFTSIVQPTIADMQHEMADAVPVELPARSPQINFSSTEVAGNIGGLIFVVGSVFVVVVGVPSVIWFLIAATAAGCFLAWALVGWHRSHRGYRLPENRIVLR
jgi:hypothetical protein